jgi:signal transduction histidine kinase
MVIAVAAATFVHSGLASDQLRNVFVPAAVALLVGLALGLWITRIIAQSTRRAALVSQLAAARAELAEMSRQAGVLAERERLAQEIHDTLAQGFASVLLLLDAAESALDRDQAAVRRYLDRARQTARENLAEARSVVAALAPPSLRHASLAEAVRQLADRAGPGVGVAPVVTVAGPPRRLPAPQEVVLLRAAQEALANVHKHASATRAELTLEYRDAVVALQLTDDGRGFDPAAPTGGFGLAGMRERVAQVGGTLAVRAAPGAGTTVRVELAA